MPDNMEQPTPLVDIAELAAVDNMPQLVDQDANEIITTATLHPSIENNSTATLYSSNDE